MAGFYVRLKFGPGLTGLMAPPAEEAQPVAAGVPVMTAGSSPYAGRTRPANR
jgi:hypothetical protein